MKKNLIARRRDEMTQKDKRGENKEKKKKKERTNKTLKIYQSSEDDFSNIVIKLLTRQIYKHHEKSTLKPVIR